MDVNFANAKCSELLAAIEPAATQKPSTVFLFWAGWIDGYVNGLSNKTMANKDRIREVASDVEQMCRSQPSQKPFDLMLAAEHRLSH